MAETQQGTTFDLHIVFGGMCLLARDEENQTLHVLLPQMHAHPGQPHDALLKFDPQYAGRGTTPAPVVLDGKQVSFSPQVQRLTRTLHPLEGVVDLTEQVQGRVPVGLLQGHHEVLRSRISLPFGQPASRSFGGWWRLTSSTPIHMATWVEWAVRGIPGDQLQVHVSDLDGSNASARNLRAVDQKIEILIFHAQPDDIPRRPRFPMPLPDTLPKEHDRVPHFGAFYQLLHGEAAKPIPVYVGPLGSTSTNNQKGIDFTCVAATAEVGG
jgi:hypothetical protein